MGVRADLRAGIRACAFRGSPASDRTFSLIGAASAVLGNLASAGSPNAIAIARAVTGIGFIGGGIVVRRAVRTGEIIR